MEETVTVSMLADKKAKEVKITMLTAYAYPTARLLKELRDRPGGNKR